MTIEKKTQIILEEVDKKYTLPTYREYVKKVIKEALF